MFKTVTDIVNTLGECPIWCGKTGRLFWADIMGHELLAHHQETGIIRRWSLPEPLGSFALTENENILLLGLASRLGYFDLTSGIFSDVAASPGVPGTRINDGRCDRSGNFVFSTMYAGEAAQVIGQFHRLNATTLEVETLALPKVAIPNSICFSPDGGTLYYSDSIQGCIFCCDYPSLSNQRVFTQVSGPGAPDGSCVDALGYLWNAEWGGSRVVRYRPDGMVDRVLSSPCIQTTCPVLAGVGLSTLYCTSARVGLTEASDNDGVVIRAETAVPEGLPESLFLGMRYKGRA
ncbi:SMP-30/gluconolactonase/LRE family protein [Klebsiella sp. BIGb0407]|uniref:SMP-30/gluconolactonase/LRE family protein n=1 Tax=Klebsiella sp. BIGb0407 TaxID=2940603 RepID=UPI002169EF60|nr:SMP-30/gluconolactonase/LRE family protein [Klebsiella sp. BIGb0407]MCS3434515.1 L-arabinonolactonase [Klebsiella sp. BIGb0407]